MITYIDALLNYLGSSSAITLLVLTTLTFYFLLVLIVFFYRYPLLGNMQRRERKYLDALTMGSDAIGSKSSLQRCLLSKAEVTRELLNVCKGDALRETTTGLTFLSIVASTSPFIGLFGTVVSILESFAQLGNETKASLSVIAPVISEALIATAAGILVAIPAYSFHLMLKRKSFEVMSLIDTQIDFLILKENRRKKTETHHSHHHQEEDNEENDDDLLIQLSNRPKDKLDAIQLG